MFNVYIADDEIEVRTGLKKIIDWETLGFKICGETGNGLTALDEIIKLQPDLVLLDIRMPKIQGLEVARKLRETNFEGHIIVLSGYSEFKYAQEAIKHDVDFYLTKPIEEEELTQAVKTIRGEISKNQMNCNQQTYYQEQAKHKILVDLLKGTSPNLNPKRKLELSLDADLYQIIIVEYFEKIDGFREMCKLLKVPVNSMYIEKVKKETFDILLLKGSFIIDKYDKWKKSHNQNDYSQLFVSEGDRVSDVNKISKSYNHAYLVKENRFFMDEYFVIASIKDVPIRDNEIHVKVNAKIIGERLYENITVFDMYKCTKTINQLRENIINSQSDEETVKTTLIGLYISLSNKIITDYQNQNFNFISNQEVIKWMQEQILLEDIIRFMYNESERVIKIIKGTSNETIIDEISAYMSYHYKEDIKLKLVAEKFGYSSSYLGKLFRKKKGISFNDYLHKIRIEKSKTLLLDERLKIYEVSEIVGYKNVDYFHLKFKELIECTPNEYRINNLINVIEEKKE